jgi:polar amino acid transport system substrate-binding protein
MKYIFFTMTGLFILALSAMLAGCADQGPADAAGANQPKQATAKIVLSSADQMETIRARGTLRVGVSLFVPWVMHDNNNKLIGYETDVARQLADNLGVDVEFIQTSWPSIIPGLLADDYDIIISGLSLTPQRALLINFSEPYTHSTSVLIASKKIAGRFTTEKQFNRKKVTIGVVKDSVGEKLIARKFPKATVKTFPAEAQAISALLDGKLYAMMSSTPRTGYLLSQHGKEVFQPFAKPFSTHAEGFGIRKGDADFLNYLNTWIRFNSQNGWLAQRHHYWFDTIDWAGQL